MKDVIIYVPTKLYKVGNQCRLVPFKGKGLADVGGKLTTVETVNPDLVYNARSSIPKNLYNYSYKIFYDGCIALGHTDEEAKCFLNKYLLNSKYEMPEPVLLICKDLEDAVRQDEASMDKAFEEALANMS